jgi:hypothetical protein
MFLQDVGIYLRVLHSAKPRRTSLLCFFVVKDGWEVLRLEVGFCNQISTTSCIYICTRIIMQNTCYQLTYNFFQKIFQRNIKTLQVLHTSVEATHLSIPPVLCATIEAFGTHASLLCDYSAEID